MVKTSPRKQNVAIRPSVKFRLHSIPAQTRNCINCFLATDSRCRAFTQICKTVIRASPSPSSETSMPYLEKDALVHLRGFRCFRLPGSFSVNHRVAGLIVTSLGPKSSKHEYIEQ